MSDLQAMYEDTWHTVHDNYIEDGLIPDPPEKHHYYSGMENDYVPVSEDWEPDTPERGGFYPADSGNGPTLHVEEDSPTKSFSSSSSGPWSTVLTGAACLGAATAAKGAYGLYKQAKQDYQDDPTEANRKTANNRAQVARGTVIAAAAACGGVIVSLASPI